MQLHDAASLVYCFKVESQAINLLFPAQRKLQIGLSINYFCFNPIFRKRKIGGGQFVKCIYLRPYIRSLKQAYILWLPNTGFPNSIFNLGPLQFLPFKVRAIYRKQGAYNNEMEFGNHAGWIGWLVLRFLFPAIGLCRLLGSTKSLNPQFYYIPSF